MTSCDHIPASPDSVEINGSSPRVPESEARAPKSGPSLLTILDPARHFAARDTAFQLMMAGDADVRTFRPLECGIVLGVVAFELLRTRSIILSASTGLARPTQSAPTRTARAAATPPPGSRERQRRVRASRHLELDRARAERGRTGVRLVNSHVLEDERLRARDGSHLHLGQESRAAAKARPLRYLTFRACCG
jgi:hypothetical protein